MSITTEQLTGQTQSHIIWLCHRIAVHKEMLTAWQKMQNSAKQDGFELTIASGFRDFDRQLSIWNRKYCGELTSKDINNHVVNINELNEVDKVNAILLYSALPGASRHHWGTDIDVYAPNLLPDGGTLQLEPWEYQAEGYFYPLSKWLHAHAAKFGFGFPYDKYRQGVAIEPWHLSYLPLAKKFQQQLTLETVEAVIADSTLR